MNRRKNKIGYCACCMQNIPWVRRVSRQPLRFVDSITFGIASLLRVGPWYCVQCGAREILRPLRKRSASTYDPSSLPQSSDVESAGNYLKTTESLIMRRNRAKRYSEKYRDGVVQKIISGTATISQLGQELNLTERDLVDWIADDLARKQERIDELTALIRSFQMSQRDQAKIGFQTLSYATDSEDTIEGDYRSQP